MRRYRIVQLFLYVHWYSFLSLIIPFFLKKKKKKGILYLAAFFPQNAGYHWRVKKWADFLIESGENVTILSAYDELSFKTLLERDLALFSIKGLKKRFWQVVKSGQYETVIVRRELLLFNDYGDLFLEKLLLKIHPDSILDFDDDISAAKNQPKKITNFVGRALRENGDKFNESLKLYKRFIVASNFLKQRVLSQNYEIQSKDICVIPTCVDYNNYPSKEYPPLKEKYTIGWIGGTHNYPSLQILYNVFERLAKKYDFDVLVIGGTPLKSENFNLVFREWSLQTEINDLMKIDIGVMPMADNDISRGKGAFKLIQYMGLGIVSVASAITINKEIISTGINSFLINSFENNDWEDTIEQILLNKINLSIIGKNARETIIDKYSFSGNQTKYYNFIRNV
jgi:glycosyltransferase involved in cell wall biosynthesis